MELTQAPQKEKNILGRTLYIPRMSLEGAAAMAAAYRSVGVNGQMVPESDASTLALARQYTIGEECYPEIVTLGGFLKVLQADDFIPEKTAFLMPTAGGPCRFGQYKFLFDKILRDKGLEEVLVVSPTSANGYGGIGEQVDVLFRVAWWSLVCADGLRKLLLQTRPYEKNRGETDRVHRRALRLLCETIEKQGEEPAQKFANLTAVMGQIADRFNAIPADYSRRKPLIGVVGEIYCRLDDFANSELIRRVEKFGGEAWLTSITEWIFYTNFMQRHDLRVQRKSISRDMLSAVVRNKVQERDEHKLLAPLQKRLQGYEEAGSIRELVKPAEPYTPYWGALGEMVLNVGSALYFHRKGADGVIDISPFTCMNGIVCEAIYPKVSRDYDDFPIRSFYFDGSEADYDRDVEIFLELARTYQRRKKIARVFPDHFPAG